MNTEEVDNHSLYRQIDQLTSQELRGVIKYLVLLNPEAVQYALNYIYQQRQKDQPLAADTSSVENCSEAEPTSQVDNDNNDEEPPLHKATQRSQPTDDIQPSMTTGSSSNNNNNKIRLVILCTMTPSSNQQAIDQDEAMVFCKHIGISLPYVVLAENRNEKTLELKSISKVQDCYPQFFVSTTKHDHTEYIEYVGSLDTMYQYKKDGILTCEQDLSKLITPSQEEAVPQEEEEASVWTAANKQLAAGGGSKYSGIPEHLQSRRDYQQAPASDLYQYLRNLAGASASTLKKKRDSDGTEEDNKFPITTTSGPLEPPTGGNALLQDNKVNREPPAQSPPQSPRDSRARDGTRNEKELSTTEPPVTEPPPTQTATPNRGAQVASSAEPPLEPPSGHKNDAPKNESQEYPSTGQDVPESPTASPGEDQATTTTGAPEISGYQEQELPPSSAADDQILDILNGVGACYLIYDESDNGGQLNIYYSETPMDYAVGVWSSNDITKFKQAQGLGTKEFIGNCASACQESPTNYSKGWIQFIKAAKAMNGTVITLTKFGMPVEFYTYSNNGGDAISEMIPGIQFETAGIDAVACMPKGTAFGYQTLRGRKWSKQAKKLGSVATFNSLVHNTGESTTKTNAKAATLTSLDVSANLDEDKTTDGGVAASSMEEPKERYPSAMAAPSPEGGACYLVYEPDSSGKLVEQYSHTPIMGAIGRWVPGPGKKIAGFKFKQNHGKKELIGNCSAGVQGRKNYWSGWNQFVRSARMQNGEVMLWDPREGAKGLTVDVWLYTNDKRPTHQSKKLERGVSTSVESILAVSTMPKNTPFFKGISIDMVKWLTEGSILGASSKFE